ncbi:MAG: hypothetical protein M1835_000444 [Candelina submexicana]|nr:MAG: hypothetical protein M1835_000444 [Candelina submexicana]
MPSRPRAGRATLVHSLDKDVYHYIEKILNDSEPPKRLTLDWVYNNVKSSNSSLKRQKKHQLEHSIDRVLDVMREDAEDHDSSSSNDERAEGMMETDQDSNIMNRSIANSLVPKANQVPSHTDRKLPLPSKKRDRQPNGEPVTKRRKGSGADRSPPSHVTLADLGGLYEVNELLGDLLVLPLKDPETYILSGLQPPRGILLHGPPGCGKTMLANAWAAELCVPFIPISAPSVVSGMSGESEKQLREYFDEAKKMAPCLIFIDEIDAITPKREGAQREMEKRIVAQMLTCLDELALEKTDGKAVIVLAATNRPDSLDPALRRVGRFDTEINLSIPNEPVREQILRTLTRHMNLDKIDYSSLAKKTPGFVGADLNGLVTNAGVVALKRSIEAMKVQAAESGEMIVDYPSVAESGCSPHVTNMRRFIKWAEQPHPPVTIQITYDDFLVALPKVQPSAKREGFATIPDTTWTDIGALQEIKAELQAYIVDPIDDPKIYEEVGITPPSGVLLWGPPGCGKTSLAKAVANESKANFISVKGPELLNKYVGESERAVRQVFVRARSSVPCVVFFDEFEALVPIREGSQSEASARVVNTLLAELDGVGSRNGIYVIAATNRPDLIDPAMLRPGRLEELIYVDLPDEDGRYEILKTLTRKQHFTFDLQVIARKCDKFSGADLESLIRQAGLAAISRRRNGKGGKTIELEDFDAALKKVGRSVSNHDMFKRIKERLGRP